MPAIRQGERGHYNSPAMKDSLPEPPCHPARRWWGTLALLLLLLVACGRRDGTALQASPTAIPPTPASVPPTEAPRPTPTPGPLILTIWAPQTLTPASTEDNGPLLARQVAEFQAQHPAIQIRYEGKPTEGRAGLLQLLRASSGVAPSVLPDLAILPTSAFVEAARAGLCQPLDRLLPDALDGYYPFVARDGRIEEALLGLPLLVSIEHLVYRPQPGILPPTTWSTLLASQQRFLFATSQSEGQISDAFLVQYAALTGTMPTSDAALDGEALRRLFDFYVQARQAGIIPTLPIGTGTPDEIWHAFVAGQGDLAEVDSHTFLTPESPTSGISYSQVPTADGAQTTVVDGYVLVMTTADPARQQAIATYLAWLLAPERLGPWAGSGGWLPTHREALGPALPNADYRRFAAGLLEQAFLRPSGPSWTPISQSLNSTLREVLAARMTPQAAVEMLLAAE